MNIKKTEAYTSLQPSLQKNDSAENILESIQGFNKNYANFRGVNLILDFSNNINTELEEILLLSPKSRNHKNNNNSFVVVYPNIDIEKMDDDLIVVPTFQEAVDIIEIEELERELGI